MLLPLGKLRLFSWSRARCISLRELQMLRAAGEQVDALQGCSDRQLQEQVLLLRGRAAAGRHLCGDRDLPAALALVREAVRRTLGMQLYDVQMLAGLVLARGGIAEMQTGEGKTLVAALPAFVRALHGKGVHVMTVNAYLAQRDHELLAPVFELLGLSSALLRPQASAEEKQRVYQHDIVYGPGYEFGFDYLRDQLARFSATHTLGDRVLDRLAGRTASQRTATQRELAFAVVDEADSVMIDEATTPLLLSQTRHVLTPVGQVFLLARETAARLQAEVDYALDAGRRTVQLTAHGVQRLADSGQAASGLGLDRPWPRYVELALYAEHVLRCDVDYTILDGNVQIVDQETGRIFAERSWRDGLHQAVQAKEQVRITAEQQPVARITRQRFFQLYQGLCGMTGTTIGSEREFQRVYRLAVTRIPTHRACRRLEYPTRCFASAQARCEQVVAEVRQVHATGRPILIGTGTIEDSQRLAAALHQAGLPAQLLNGKQDADEAEIVAAAGLHGTITIATNMAGRGTDIKLGDGVAALGGLHVIACQRHESRRVDRQLAGRAARQGDPGSVRFYVAADDPLIAQHAAPLARRIERQADARGEYHRDIVRAVTNAQRRAEAIRYRQRQDLFGHDDWIDRINTRLQGRGPTNNKGRKV